MKFFRRNKKAASEKTSMSKTPSAEKKEPLIETVPADEPADDAVVVEKNEDMVPSWTDVDGNKAARINDPEEGDTDLTVSTGYRDELAEKRRAAWKIKMEESWKTVSKKSLIVLGCFGAQTSVLIAIYSALAVGVVALFLMAGPNHIPVIGGDLNIAFIGNSYFFVNDFPRLFEKVTGDHIFQDSCLHGSGSILNILKTGNGMYYKWQSQNAMINGVEWETEDNGISYLYDYGACSVPQLLTGQDHMLSYGNQDGHYIDDGTNPCLVDDDYLDYENSYNYTENWDYVVIVDQSKRMCFEDARQEALMAFNYTYGPLLDRNGAVPVLVQPHAFWSNMVNMTGLTDVPTFTSMITEGTQIYKQFLDSKLSNPFHRARVAPVGDAFLTVWEEDQELWSKLFLGDGIHPSGYGSYLYAMVLHATIYNILPPRSRVIVEDPMELFGMARKLHSNETGMPDKDEALYLWKIARRVGLFGYKPSSLKSVGQEESDYDMNMTNVYDDDNNNEDQQQDQDYGDDNAGYQGEGYEYYYNQTDDGN